MESKEWFEEWFDSNYYHILYKDRNYTEAETFISNLISFLHPPTSVKIIDLACGKGRHSIYLNKLGFDVTGVDLSENSINHAKAFENEKLHFKVADLRELPYNETFDIAVNLFTSFGYFESDETNKTVFNQFNKILKPKGVLVLDFFNAAKIYSQTNCSETKEIEGITFEISKKIRNKRVDKKIEFNHNGKDYYFSESVQLLLKEDFENLVHTASFNMLHIFGSYQLQEYNEQTSERLIIIAQKND